MSLRRKPHKALLFALALALGPAPSHAARAADSPPAADQTLHLNILSADDRQVIGATRFTLSPDSSGETITGETRYADGQHDNEVDRIQLVSGRLRLARYEHSFFAADGTIIMSDTLDSAAHTASCSRREDGVMRVRSARFDFPADTFGGGSQLLIVTADLRDDRREIDFHAFACVPGPHLFQVNAHVPRQPERWPLYPGDLVRLDLRPDLGAGLNFVVAPFLPTTAAWFDPHDHWNYVGGEFNRYFGGPHVFQVLVPRPNP